MEINGHSAYSGYYRDMLRQEADDHLRFVTLLRDLAVLMRRKHPHLSQADIQSRLTCVRLLTVGPV